MYLPLIPGTERIILHSNPAHQVWLSKGENSYWRLNIHLNILQFWWTHDLYAYEENGAIITLRNDDVYIRDVLAHLIQPVYIKLPEGYYGVLYPEYGAIYDPKVRTWFKALDIFELSYLHRYIQDNPQYHLHPTPEGYDRFKLYILSSQYN